MIDVILISDAKRGAGYNLTVQAIKSLVGAYILNPAPRTMPVIYVVESDHATFYERISTEVKIKTIHPKQPFNYNRYLNLAIKQGKGEYVALCNNDLYFEPFWAETLINTMLLAEGDMKEPILSASPYCPYSQGRDASYPSEQYLEGYKIRYHISGWCIFVKRKIFNKIGKLNEEVNFWFSDNIYVDQLKKEKLKHILATRSIVRHVEGGSNTLKTVGDSMADQLTTGQSENYRKAKENVFPEPDPPISDKTREEYRPKHFTTPPPKPESGKRFN